MFNFNLSGKILFTSSSRYINRNAHINQSQNYGPEIDGDDVQKLIRMEMLH